MTNQSRTEILRELDKANTRVAELENASSNVLRVIERAGGVSNLMRTVELGELSWSDRLQESINHMNFILDNPTPKGGEASIDLVLSDLSHGKVRQSSKVDMGNWEYVPVEQIGATIEDGEIHFHIYPPDKKSGEKAVKS